MQPDPSRCLRARSYALWFCGVSVALCACFDSRTPDSPAPDRAISRAPQQPLTPVATACSTDQQCNFTDPCQPVRCVATPARPACSHPATPDGSCVCFEGQCALRPSSPRISPQSCKDAADCALDLTTARCEPGIAPDDDFRVRYAGPTCSCDQRDHRCHLQWFDLVPCRSVDDCWVDETDRPHAIARPRKLKGRVFRGCVDGERVPACVNGHCTLNALTC